MRDTTAANITITLEQVGPRLKRLRTQPRMTLIEGASGYRYFDAHVVAVGDRCAATRAEIAACVVARLSGLSGRPRRGARGRRSAPTPQAWSRKGGSVIRSTRQPTVRRPGNVVIPTSQATLERRTHDGHDWICTVSWHWRFVLGDRDLVLAAGDVGLIRPAWCRTGSAVPAANSRRS